MQERLVDQRAPIAAVERFLADEIERAGNRLALDERKDEEDSVPHPLAEQGERGARQIGPAPLARAGVLVEVPERVPMLGPDVGPAERADLDPILCGGAFLADVLALARGERGEEIVEACIAAVFPVNWISSRTSQPAASNSGSCAGSMKVACADDRPWRSQNSAAAWSRGAASAGSRVRTRGPVAGVNGAAIWSLG